MPDADYVERVLPFVHARGVSQVTAGDVRRALFTIRERAETFWPCGESVCRPHMPFCKLTSSRHQLADQVR
jgi:hypothetical protein